ncbi:MAG: NAD-dependent epimerase/dehydratase family protein [Terracidiphilus sp.]|jgi:nucleoside-diphosphate-sugar epimerase
MNERVLVTGADGFVGRSFCRRLIEAGFTPLAGLRTLARWAELQTAVPGLSETILLGDLSANRDLRDRLAGIPVIVHLAANTSPIPESAEALREYRHVNVDGTRSMARAAAASGVRRFVFASTAKVHGEATTETPFTEDAPANPRSSYAVSKWEAEEALRSIAAESGMEAVVVRPPLVYGPGVRGNFLRLIRFVDHGLPLPLPRERNCRSLINVENLADFLVRCVSQDEAGNRSFLVSDGEDLSTRELVERLARLLARPVRLLTAPEALIRFAAKVAGKEDAARRMLDSFVIDSSRAQHLLRWTPQVGLDEGLSATVRWFREPKPAW